jgi:hypothetical protein
LQTGDLLVFFGLSTGKLRDTVDGSIPVMGFRIAFSASLLAQSQSQQYPNFGSNGSFDLKVHSEVYEDFV